MGSLYRRTASWRILLGFANFVSKRLKQNCQHYFLRKLGIEGPSLSHPAFNSYSSNIFTLLFIKVLMTLYNKINKVA